MEKEPMYTDMVSAHPPPYKRQWATWAAVGMALVALVVAGVTASMAVRQMDRANQMEGRLMEMQGKVVELEGHMLEVLEYSLSSHDYFDYEDDLDGGDNTPSTDDDSQAGPYEHLTVQRVVRRRRQVDNSVGPDVPQGAAVPIYDQAYGVNLKGRSTSEGLRLYESLQATKGLGDPTSSKVTVEVTESPIKPYHRISSMWVPKKPRRRYPASSLSTRNLDRDDDNINARVNRRRAAVIERRSRTKSLHGSGRGVRPRQKHRALSNQNPVSVQFRDTRVKATSRHHGFDSSQNSVVPQPAAPLPETSGGTVVVQQGPGLFYSRGTPEGYTRHPASPITKEAPRKRRPRKRRGGRRRRNRSATSLAHFVASNSTSQGSPNALHHAWTPAAWMDKLGLNRKYPLDQDTVVVKEAGLYYLYAQVLYESGRSGSGFQILVDDIPIMECTLAPAQPSPSCHTAGASYLPRHAALTVRDLDQQHARPVRSHHNTFFGLVKLMDAPDSAEQLLLP